MVFSEVDFGVRSGSSSESEQKLSGIIVYRCVTANGTIRAKHLTCNIDTDKETDTEQTMHSTIISREMVGI